MSVSAGPWISGTFRHTCFAERSPPTHRNVKTFVGSNVSAETFLSHFRNQCETPLPLLRHVADSMASDMRSGLTADGASDLPMILSHVDALPTGDESGLFYALDLGGTNFRVLRVQLGGREARVVATEFNQVSVPDALMCGTSEELFDFIAGGLEKFEKSEGGKFEIEKGRKKELGFTFSFPVKQTAIDSGVLIKWTKGFAVSGTAGRDVVRCLNEAMERRGMEMRVSALVNDTVATLAGARYWDEDVVMAVIIGTGTNACYVEETRNIPKLGDRGSGRTIVNMEWGAFSKGIPLTEFDREVDRASINPGEQILEKTISGMYLGEIARRVLHKMAEETSLFGNSVPPKLSSPFSLGTPSMCAMQKDDSYALETVGRELHELLGVETSVGTRRMVVGVFDAIVRRGGRLAGAGVVGILEKMREDGGRGILERRNVVAMDGGLYEKYVQYRGYMKESVEELLGGRVARNVEIEHTKDGSGIGAALLAAKNSMYC